VKQRTFIYALFMLCGADLYAPNIRYTFFNKTSADVYFKVKFAEGGSCLSSGETLTINLGIRGFQVMERPCVIQSLQAYDRRKESLIASYENGTNDTQNKEWEIILAGDGTLKLVTLSGADANEDASSIEE